MINQFFLVQEPRNASSNLYFSLSGNLQRYSVSLNYRKRTLFLQQKVRKYKIKAPCGKIFVDNSKCLLFKENGVTEHVSETSLTGACNHSGAIMPGLITFQIKDDLILKTVNINYF